MTAQDDPGLSLREIEAVPRQVGPRGEGWRSYLCPLPACAGKVGPSLRVNMATGGWQCHRCGATGLLVEWRDRERAGGDVRARGQRVLDRSTRPRAVVPETAPAPETWGWRDQWDASVPILDDRALPGIAYLWGRAIIPATAAAAGVRFHPHYGTPQNLKADDGTDRWRDPGPAVLVPLWAPQGPSRELALTGVQGRYIDGREANGWRKVQTGGGGAFLTAGADDADPVAIVEGPLDALALADGGPGWDGVPAIACTRASIPPWLASRVLGRRVILALDADDAGDRGADRALPVLQASGATVTRVRPPHGAKDWADARIVEWRATYRPRGWPPPHDPEYPALDDLPDPRNPPPLPAGWWPGHRG